MHIRQGTPEDIERMGEIGLLANATSLLYEYTFPHRDSYPDDYAQWWTAQTERIFFMPGSVVIVAEEDVSAGKSTVVSFSIWFHKPAKDGDTLEEPTTRGPESGPVERSSYRVRPPR